MKNRTMVASLFRRVPAAAFDARIRSIYLDVAKEWGNAVIRLAVRAGIELEASASPGAKLKRVQELLAQGDPRARRICETLGVYLGYGLLQYAEFYPVKHVLLLGRVTSGQAGSILLEQARQVLAAESPELANALKIHLPDEATRRVGQSIAAASLPRLHGH